jgi:hypothetical protein
MIVKQAYELRESESYQSWYTLKYENQEKPKIFDHPYRVSIREFLEYGVCTQTAHPDAKALRL